MQKMAWLFFLLLGLSESSSIRGSGEDRNLGLALVASSRSTEHAHESQPYGEDFKGFGEGEAGKDFKVVERRSIQSSVNELEANVPHIIDEDELEEDHALQTVHSIARNIVVPSAVVFMMSLAVAHVLSLWEWTQWIPESAAIMMTAMLLGRLIKVLLEHGAVTHSGFALGAATTLNLLLLPVIIFVSGWEVRRADFIYQFNPILIFAIMGTIISTFVIGYGSYFAAALGLHAVTDLRSNLAFGALISAVDPVATLVTYKALNVEPLLNIIVFGESTINDAVAVVMFSIMNETWHSMTFGGAIWRGVQLLFGSMVFGVLVASFIIFIMRITKMKQEHGKQHIATFFMWCSPFAIYAAAEATGVFSGIIATLLAGIIFGAYGRPHLEDGGKETDSFFEMTASLADKTVFILCGAATGLISSYRGYMFGAVAVVLCIVGRACSVGPSGLLVNAYKRQVSDTHTLSWQHLAMMIHGGLRGAIALVLALQLDATWCQFKATIVNGTFIVICALLLFCGGSTELLLKKLEIPMGSSADWAALEHEKKGPMISSVERLDAAMMRALVGEPDQSGGLIPRKATGLMSNPATD